MALRSERGALLVASMLAGLGSGIVAPPDAGALCLTPPGDVNGNGVTNVADVQCVFLGALWQLAGGVGPVPGCAFGGATVLDLNCNGTIQVDDAQLTAMHALGLPLPLPIDSNQNRCVDACEAASAVCGNGIIEIGEECDDGPGNSDILADFCRTDCTLPGCGDGVVDSGEQCDDGNLVAGDGCEPDCTFTAGAATALPYVQDFNLPSGAGYASINWQVESDPGSAANNWTLATSGPLGPDRHPRFNAAPTVTQYTDTIVSPLLDGSAASFVTLSFDQAISMTSAATSETQLQVLASGDGGQSWTTVWARGGDAGSMPAQRTVVDISSAAGGSAEARVAFRISGPTSAHLGYWEIDDVDVRAGAPPVLAPVPTQSLTAGQTQQLTVWANDLDTPAEDLEFSLAAAPAFVTLTNQGDGTAQITLAPSGAHVGTYSNVRVRCTDGTFTTEQLFDIFVSASPEAVPAYVVVRSAAAGAGAPVGDMTLQIGQAPLNLHCAAYNAGGTYLQDIACTWTRTGTIPAPPSGPAAAIVYNPSTPGTGFITATPTASGVAPDSTGTLTVQLPPDLGISQPLSTVEVSPAAIEANGISTATITVSVFTSLGQPLQGADVVIHATAGTLIGAVTEPEPGVYKQTVQAGTTVSPSSITATVDGQPLNDSALLSFVSFFTVTGTTTVITCDNYGEWYGRNIVVDGTLTIDSNPTASNPGGCAPMVFGDIVVKDNRILQHSATTAASDGERWMDIEVQTLFVEGPNGRIDVNGRGYLGSPSGQPGYWLGNTTAGGAAVYTGGSHGGVGAGSDATRAYGDLVDPRTLGAGGGFSWTSGSAGGGAVRIKAHQSVIVDGRIEANGQVGAACGAGGSVSIETPVLGGNGHIHALGGSGSYPGGGGRIAVRGYSLLAGGFAPANLAGKITARAQAASAGAGTVFLMPASGMEHGWLIVDNANASGTNQNAPAGSTPLLIVEESVASSLADDTLTDFSPGWRAGQYVGTYVNPNIHQPGGAQGPLGQEIFRVVANDDVSLSLEGDVPAASVVPTGAPIAYRGVFLVSRCDIRGGAAVMAPGDVVVFDGNGLSPTPGTFVVNGRLDAIRVDVRSHDAITVAGGGMAFESIYSGDSALTPLHWTLSGAKLDTGAVYAQTLLSSGVGAAVTASSVAVAGPLHASSTTFSTGQISAADVTLVGAPSSTVGVISATQDLRIDGGVWSAGELLAGRDIVLAGNASVDIRDEVVHANRKIELRDTSRLRHEAIAPDGPLERLHLVAQSVVVLAGAEIDVSGRGFAGSVTWLPAFTIGNLRDFGADTNIGGSHGGLGVGAPIANAYGSPFEPVHAGGGGGIASWGAAGGNGGGVVRIEASALVRVDGFIRANGLANSSGGAGGSIWITTLQLAGNGEIQANGSAGSYPGGGGRIALRGFLTRSGGFAGANIVNKVRAVSTTTSAGAGTVYLRAQGQQYGELIVDNGGSVAPVGSTPILVVSQDVSSSVSGNQLGNGGAAWRPDRYVGSWVNPNVNQSGVNAPMGDDQLFYVSANDFSSLTLTGAVPLASVATAGDTYRGVLPLDRLEIRGRASVRVDGDVFVRSGGVTSSDPTALELGGQLIAHRVDFNAISAIVANQGGIEADVVFTQGEDDFPLDITLSSTSTLKLPSLNTGNFTATGSSVEIAGPITVNGDLSLTNMSKFDAGDVTVSGAAILDAAVANIGRLSAQFVEVKSGNNVQMDQLISGSNAFLRGNASVTIHDAQVQAAGAVQLFNTAILRSCASTATKECRLDIQASSLLVDSGARIDADACGYLGAAAWAATPGYSRGNDTTLGAPNGNAGSHGGIGSGPAPSAARVYDNLFDPKYPGGGGGQFSGVAGGAGGGAIRIVASNFVAVDGRITANGAWGGGGGAGGTINVTAPHLGGNGSLEVNGGGSSWYPGGGGRIALRGMQTLAGQAFTGSTRYDKLQARSGGADAGAGTIYMQRAGQQFGDLIVDNGPSATPAPRSTPLPVVPERLSTSLNAFSSTLTDVVAQWEPGLYVGTRVNPNLAQAAPETSLELLDLFMITANTEDTLGLIGASSLGGVAQAGDPYRGVFLIDNLDIRRRAAVHVDGDLLVQSGDLGSGDDATLALGGRLEAKTVDVRQVTTLTLQDHGGLEADRLIAHGQTDFPLAISMGTGSRLVLPSVYASTLITTGGTIITGPLVSSGTVALSNTALTATEVEVTGNFTSVAAPTPGLSVDLIDATGTVTFDGGTLNHVGQILAGQDVELRGPALVFVHEEVVQSGGVLRVRDTARLHSCVSTAAKECKLDIGASTVVVYPQARIDVDGRGYMGSTTWNVPARTFGNVLEGALGNQGGSHGGLGGAQTDAAHAFDSLADPRASGGGGGSATGGVSNQGGGVVRIAATNSVIIDGRVTADATYVHGNPGGAGGAVNITTHHLGGTGEIWARGGAAGGYAAGGGGRVALRGLVSQADSFTATQLFEKVDARGGAGNPNGGAGTIFVKRAADTHGWLIVDNRGVITPVDSTPIPVVPEGTVIQFTSTPTRTLTDFGAQWPAGRYVGTWVNPNLAQPNAAQGLTTQTLFQITGHTSNQLTLSGAGSMGVTSVGAKYRGVLLLDRLSVRRRADVKVDGEVLVLSGNVGATAGDPWELDGFFEAPVLDLNTTSAVSIIGGGLQVEELVGSAQPDFPFEVSLSGTGATFTESTVHVTDLVLQGAVTLSTEALFATGDVTVNAATLSAGDVEVDGTLRFESTATGTLGDVQAGAFEVAGGNVTVETLTAATDVTLSGSGTLTVNASTLEAGEAVVLLGTSRLRHAQSTATQVHDLSISADIVSVGTSAQIDGMGRGYLGSADGNPARTFGNATSGGAAAYQGGSHGGRGQISDGSALGPHAYGSLFDPALPGGGGGWGSGKGGDGGGVIRIEATSAVVVDGEINVDGEVGAWSHAAGGAGGSIRIVTPALTGGGWIRARGGAGTNLGAGGGGGRIAILGPSVLAGKFALDGIWDGVQAHGGLGYYNANRSGAGTVYVQMDGQTWGDLIVDNGSATGNPTADSTPLITFAGGTVSAMPTPSQIQDNAGNWIPDLYVGSWVNPNISQGDPARRVDDVIFPVTANTINVLTAGSPLDALTSTGQTYRGIYRFRNLEVRNRAQLLVAGDLVVLQGDLHSGDTVTFELPANTHLRTTVLDLNQASLTGDGTVDATVVP